MYTELKDEVANVKAWAITAWVIASLALALAFYLALTS